MDQQQPQATADERPTWDAALYDGRFTFVWEYGGGLLDLLDPQPGERILDLGCGTGHLTRAIADHGAEAVGVDLSAEMIEQARRHYPDLSFAVADATHLTTDVPFDAVFSNAVLHWVSDPAAAIASIAAVLRVGGRLVAEFGGRGNVDTLVQATTDAIRAAGHDPGPNPWYFPSIGEYATLLEQHGLEPVQMALIDRPTKLDGGPEGLRLWLTMFAGSFFNGLAEADREAIIRDIEHRLRPVCFQDGHWYADYRRLRLVALRR